MTVHPPSPHHHIKRIRQTSRAATDIIKISYHLRCHRARGRATQRLEKGLGWARATYQSQAAVSRSGRRSGRWWSYCKLNYTSGRARCTDPPPGWPQGDRSLHSRVACAGEVVIVVLHAPRPLLLQCLFPTNKTQRELTPMQSTMGIHSDPETMTERIGHSLSASQMLFPSFPKVAKDTQHLHSLLFGISIPTK